MAKNDFLWLYIATMDTHMDLYILDYPGAMPSAVSGIQDLFTIANQHAEQALFSVHPELPAVNPKPTTQTIIFIPPCLKRQFLPSRDPETLAVLTSWHQSGAVLVAACAGVFWLANAGLLDGKHATTHWKLCQYLSDNYPAIEKVSQREMVVDQGDIVTAAGLYAFQDLALHIMARFAGYSLAKEVADFCLLDLGGRLQAYYQRFYPDFSHADDTIIKAQRYCSQHIYTSISIADLAEHCRLSQRTLLRRFKVATGYSPKQYILQLKVEKARLLMEMEKLSIDEIGYKMGYTDTSNFVKVFKKVAGITPTEFRARFAC